MNNNQNYIEFNDIINSKIVAVDLFEKKILIKNFYGNEFDAQNYLKTSNKNIRKYIYNLRERKKNITFTIVTTLNCNLSCSYCYEKNYKNISQVLSNNKCFEICEYIIKYINYYKAERVKIIFTGGEPLLNKKAIFYIMEFFSNKKILPDVLFKFSIVTNGTISLSLPELKFLNEHGLDLIQVSLDGSQEIHNKRRLAKFNAFEKTKKFLFDNSKYDFSIVIRTNIDEENIAYYADMLDNIKELKNKNVMLSLYQTEKPICERCINNFTNKDQSILLTAIDIAINKGFTLVPQKLFFSACISIVEIGQFIDTEGNIYKCGGMIGHKNEIVGNINNFENMLYNVSNYIDKKLSDDCYTCKMFPLCSGGCIYNKYYTIGCSKEFKASIYNKIRNNLILYLKKEKLW